MPYILFYKKNNFFKIIFGTANDSSRMGLSSNAFMGKR